MTKINNKKLLFGFSTGALHREADAKQALQIIKNLGCPAVELGFVKKSRIEQGWLENITKEDLDGFEYVSLHAPKMYYKDDEETREMFRKISEIHKKLRPLDLVVFHPDNVVEARVFDGLPFPVGFENMDRQKPFGKTPDDLLKLFKANPNFRFVLDVNHIKSNDPAMRAMDEFYATLGDKLVEYHISGLGEDYPHLPLFQTKEKDILSAVRDLTKPIICESRLLISEIKQEKEYIESTLLRA
jgi:hypothetical protein